MPEYVDGYVLPIPTDKIPDYRKLAKMAAKVWKEHGALDYRECIGDDLEIKGVAHFPKVFKTKPNETVVFSWVTFKSRKDRDRVNAQVMSDPRLNTPEVKNMPFDMKKMVYGGFKTLVSI